jgi:predicted transcriptional regulator
MLYMASRYFSITIPQELEQKAKRLAEVRNQDGKGARWSKNLIIRRALEAYLEEHVQELEGGAVDQVLGEHTSPAHDHRLREVENPPLHRVAQRKEKNRG